MKLHTLSFKILAACLTFLSGVILVETCVSLEQRDYYSMRQRAGGKPMALIGNCMLGRGVKKKLFENLLGYETVLLSKTGSRSAWWYLALKNAVIPAPNHPKTVLIIFRDPNLTHPNVHVRGHHAHFIRMMSTPHEPVLNKLAYENKPPANLSFFLGDLLDGRSDILSRKIILRDDFFAGILDLVARHVLGTNGFRLNKSFNRVFDIYNKIPRPRRQTQKEYPKQSILKNYDFDRAIKRSFLPPMIDLAEKNGIRLILVKTKRIRQSTPFLDKMVGEYEKKLSQYLDERGITLLDLSKDPRMNKKPFLENEHFNREGQAAFTRMLADAVKNLNLNPRVIE